MTLGNLNSLLTLGGTCAGLAGVAARGIFSPQSQVWGKVIWRGPADPPSRVALTFDDGPTRGPTGQILDVLAEMDVKAAFFVIGRNVENCPDLLQRIDADGHVIGAHSYDHRHFGAARHGRYWNRQFERTNQLIERLIGKRPVLFRPPLGQKNPFIMHQAKRHGHIVVTWNRSGLDGIDTTTDRILARLAPLCAPGDILALHDGIEPHRHRDPSASVGAVRPLIESLRHRGLSPVRLDEMLGVEPYAAAAVNQPRATFV